ncbi:MAG: phenylalanine--tRNA ligase subunit beta [Nitrospirae bacterium]|nr:phenylalanine--tRNA ligase subunit beta [Candidatus Troglogloeales bacterium]
MPTIEVKRADLELLLGERINKNGLLALLPLVKGEMKEWTEDILKLELNDSNRPDLWSSEGIARQFRIHAKGASETYSFFAQEATQTMTVSKAVMAIRPYLGGFLVRGLAITESVLTQLIQSQEKLAEIFGQQRKALSIGLYRLHKIAFPVLYDVADREATRFTPLGFDTPMSLSEILKNHPKGITFGEILKGHTKVPILTDANNQILSFPPIINSREIGQVCVGDTDLLIEATGTNLRQVMLAINIFACNLADRGGLIEPLSIEYPTETVKMPYDFSKPIEVALSDFARALGELTSQEEAISCLTSYGYKIDAARVTLPAYRDDVMHPIDIVEDFAISRGYDTFVPTLPTTATIGSRSLASKQSARLAEAMIGFGFEEVLSNLLSSYEEQCDFMGGGLCHVPEGRIVAIENPMTERYAVSRSWILPSLLRVEGSSSKAYYPHRLFEIGEVARMSSSGDDCKTALHLGAMISHAEANFSELHAVLSALFHSLSLSVRLSPISHPTFIPGQTGAIVIGDQEIGLIGEIHPEVLTQWKIRVPTAAFEIETGLL